jgi:hypothetical protein
MSHGGERGRGGGGGRRDACCGRQTAAFKNDEKASENYELLQILSFAPRLSTADSILFPCRLGIVGASYPCFSKLVLLKNSMTFAPLGFQLPNPSLLPA